jgi:acetyl esterase/lipase
MAHDRCTLVCVSLVWLLLLAACQPAEPGLLTPTAATGAGTLSARPGPTFAPPSTRVFPTPEVTPTRWPTPQVPGGAAIEQELDVPYTSVQDLDVYWPESGNGWPIVVLLHGGNVDKTHVRGLAMRVAGHGAVIFVPEYQSYEPPPDRITRGVEEAACAVRFAKAHGAEYGGDSEQVIIVGHSAGGAFGALVALAGDTFPGDCLVADGDTTPNGLIGLDGAYDLPRYTSAEKLGAAPAEEWLRISPYAYVNSVPRRAGLSFHLFVGLEPGLLQDAQAFRDALQRAGYEVTLTQFPGINHMRMASERHENTVWAIVTLLGE